MGLRAAIPSKQLSLISLTLQETVPERGEEVLNKLMVVYMDANVDDKNRIADSTMRFINERLTLVSQELSGIEKDIESFKRAMILRTSVHRHRCC